MKILIPTADYPPIVGGISQVALHVARELSRLGHDVTVIAPKFPGWREFDSREGMKVIRFGGYRLGWLRFLPMLASAWRQAGKSDLILGINVAYGGVIGLLARKGFGTPYVTFGYAYEFLRFREHRLFGALLRRVYEQARVIVAISRFTRDNLLSFGAPAEKIDVIHPGAPAAKRNSEEELEAFRRHFTLDGCRVILGIGRFVPRKGHITLVRAMPKILEEIPNALLVLVGKGPRLHDVICEAYDLGVRENTLFPGLLSEDEISLLYQACEVFALPCGDDGKGQVEGFGLVFAEANAYGKPVVAGRSGGVSEAVVYGETGIVVEPEQPEAVAEAILSLMRDGVRAREMGERGRSRVENELSWSRFTERLLDAVEARGR